MIFAPISRLLTSLTYFDGPGSLIIMGGSH